MKRSWLSHLFISLSIGMLSFGAADAATLVPITACSGCHGTDPQTNQAPIEGSQRNVPPRAIVGTHATHNSSLICSGCHVMPTALNHMDTNINMSATISGGTYSKSQTFPVSNSSTGGQCNSTSCHGQSSPAWGGAPASTTTCTKCHGQPNAAYLTNYTSAVIAPGTGTTGRDTAGNTAATAPRVGAHKAHMEGSVITGGDISRTIRCRECHTPHATVNDATHLNRSTATITFGSIAQSNGHTTANVTRTSGIITCNNTYCHTGKLNTGAAMAPTWNATGYLSAGVTITDCKQCHGMPPTPNAGAHSTVNNLTALPVGAGTCNCHGNLNPTGNTYATMFVNKAIHVDGTIDVSGSHAFPYPGATHMSATGATTPSTTCNCHSLTAGVYPTTGGAAPACMGCHVNGLLRTVSAVASCYDCHGATATDGRPVGTTFPDIAGSHASGHNNFGCATCHNGFGTGTASHGSQNRTAKVRADVKVAFAAPNTAGTWSFGALTCSALYCHSTVQNATGTGIGVSDPAVTWGTGTLNCSTNCHGDVATRLTTGDHTKHLAITHAVYTCDYCHTGAGEGSVLHANNVVNVSMSTFGGGTYSDSASAPANGAFGTCATIYCHSSVQSATGGVTPASYKTPTWGGVALACNGCHGNTTTDLTTGSHSKHLDSNHASFSCATCHTGFDGGNTVNHANKIINVAISTTFGGAYSDPSGAPGNGFGTCNTTYCHSNVQSATGGANTPKLVTWGVTLTCAGCHGNTVTDLLSGTHSKHLNATYGYACSDCHGTAGGAGNTGIHVNNTINVDLVNRAGGGTLYSYSGDGTPGNSNFGACNNTVCHGKSSGTWGSSVSSQLCTECHGQPNVAYPNFSSAIIAPGGSGVDTGGNTAATSPRVGAHQGHLTGALNMSDKVHCGECHTTHIAINDGTHLNYTTATVSFATAVMAKSAGKSPSLAKVNGIVNCSNTYCHTGNRTGATAFSTTPVWNASTTLLGNTTIADTCTRKCHAMPPGNATNGGVTGDTHFGLADVTTPAGLSACSSNSPATGCHPNINAAPTTMANIWSDKLLHINGSVDGGTCVGCHSKAITRAVGRAAGKTLARIDTEFGLAWGHKKTGRGTVADADCVACHLEGVGTTGKPSATYHKNGNIDLRDPDGTGDAAITNISNGAFTFARFSTSYAAASRTSTGHTSNTDIANVVTQKFCLKCHDANGATNTTARGSGTTPTATAPFGGGFTVNNAAAAFATTNSSKHPVMGPLTKDFPTPAHLLPPYNNFTRAGTSGTKTVGVVINCFDCHNRPTSPYTLRTVAAHGSNATDYMRGIPAATGTAPTATTGSTLCLVCHTNNYTAGNYSHGAGSAYSASSGRSIKAVYLQFGCNRCHASNYTTATTRPTRAEDVHGNNTVPAGLVTKTGRWALTTTRNVPVAFIRNSSEFSNHQPLSLFGTGYTPQCMGGNQSPCSQGTQSYSVGGTY